MYITHDDSLMLADGKGTKKALKVIIHPFCITNIFGLLSCN
jgi:hypothetical protein